MTLTGQFLPAGVSADPGQVGSRSITISSSAPSATGVTYTIKFTPATATTGGTGTDIIVDFCSNDPLIGDSCTATAGTDVPDFSGAAISTSDGAAGWTLAKIGSNRGVKLSNTTALLSAGTPITLTVTGVTNPSNVATSGSPGAGTFYGRILTYSGRTAVTDSATPGSPVDTGGIALSTASNINITSKVFETLSYCVFQTACGTAPQLALGDTSTGALDVNNAYVNANAQYTIATNAGGGAAVMLTGHTLCRTPGTPANCATGSSVYTITATGDQANVVSVPGSEQFGMCVDATGSNGGLAAQAPYNDLANSCHTGISTGIYTGNSDFAFDDNSTTGTASASGVKILQSTGAISTYTGTFAFLGNISATTEAGIYQTSLNTVATGTF